MTFTSRLAVWISFLIAALFVKDSSLTEPDANLQFKDEPPYRLEFSNSTGIETKCSATGTEPISISWIMTDGNQIQSVPGLRRVSSDGTLIFTPFRAEDYRQDMHDVKYRCVASNELGSIISREVHVHAVMDQSIEPHVYDAFATRGSVALFKCAVPGMIAHYIRVISWIKDNQQKIDTSFFDDKKNVITPSGDLLVTDIKKEDSGSVYRCQVKHRLSGLVKTSVTAGKLFVTEPEDNVPVTILPMSNQVSVNVREKVALPCIVQGYPIPSVKWFRSNVGHDLGSIAFDAKMKVTKLALIIDDIKPEDSGNYVCIAESSIGTKKFEFTLTVNDPLVVSVKPHNVRLDGNKAQELECDVNKNSITTLSWYRNGNLLPLSSIPSKQVINQSGIYQCFATTGNDMEHGVALVTSGASTPDISTGFEEKTVQPGINVKLQCKATGNPLPKFTWYLEDTALNQSGKIVIEEKVDASIITLFNVKMDAGGVYKCTAVNEAGTTSFTNRVNIYGQLNVRPMSPTTVVSGKDFRINCPYYGYPVTEVQWEKNSVKLPALFHQNAFTNGTLIIANVKKGLDDGIYTCIVSNIQGQSASGSINVTVMIPPKIISFAFLDDQFYKGMRAHVSCAVSQGDPPLTIQWSKDSRPVTGSTDIVVRQFDTYTSSLSIENVNSNHTGNYTCVVINRAATVTHTAQLLVHAAPKIIPFSFQDDHLFEGVLARVSCVVYQGDLPISIRWIKDGNHLVSRDNISIRNIDAFSSTLTIDKVQQAHSGNYTCIAENAAASANSSAVLVVNVPPKIVPFTFQEEHLLEGMLVRVSCVVSRGDLPLNITWLKDGDVIPSGLLVEMRNFDDYSNVLSINPLSRIHNGNYTCIAKNSAGTDLFNTGITVKELPKWIVSPNDTKVLMGSSVTLPCSTSGFPKPTTTWFKVNGSDVRGIKNKIEQNIQYNIISNGSLHIKNINLENAGYYFCVSNNSIGTISALALLSISFPPQLDTYAKSNTVKLGETVYFKCTAHGDQPMSFTWFVDNQQVLSSSGHRYSIHQAEENGKVSSQLVVEQAERRDSANFSCIAENSYGKQNGTFMLTVLEKPEKVQDLKMIESNNRTIVVGWKAPFNGNSPITKYILQYKHTLDEWNSGMRNLTIPGHKLQSAITGLKPSTKYDVRVIAVNEIGVANPSDGITISMAEQAPGGSPLNVTAIATDAHSLKVSWMPPRRDLWNGVIRGYHVGFRPFHSSSAYSFRMLEVPEEFTSTLSLPLTGLQKFTQYSIIVQAFNDGGKGPLSSPLVAMTSESVPTKPPQDITCSILSSQSIHVNWQSPPSQSMHGILQGYKIMYKPVDDQNNVKFDVKNVGPSNKITIKNLEKFTNYSVQVLAATRRGDGVKSESIFCKTAEDVPSAPSDVKALPTSPQSILVAWKPPAQPNGIVLKYSVYLTQFDSHQEKSATKHNVNGNVTYLDVSGLKKDETYKLWVSATTIVGESNKSRVVSQSTSNVIVAANIAGFDGIIHVSEGEDVLLPCKAIGQPTPQKTWIRSGIILPHNNRYQTMADGSLLIKDTEESDTSNYTCQVQNEHGQDQITYNLQIQSSPGVPYIEIALITTSSIDIQWKISSTGGSPILGYKLYYKHDHNEWETIDLDGNTNSHQLSGLHCGTRYQIEMMAYNRLGQGKLSPIINTATKGGVPVPPTKKSLIEEGSTFISLNLDSWLVDKCPVKYYVIEYKSKLSNQWRLLSDDIKPEKRKLVLSDLFPATWYNLRMIAHSSAGTAAAEFTFATLTTDGATILPVVMADDTRFRPIAFQFEIKHMIAITSSVLIIILVVVIIWICAQNKKSKLHKRSKSGRRAVSEAGSDATYDSSYGYSAGQSTISRDPRRNLRKGDLTPYATAHLADHYQPEEMIAFDTRQSMVGQGNTLPGMTVPFYPQGHARLPANGFGDGVFPSTVDVINLYGHRMQQFPIVPMMANSFGANGIASRACRTSTPNSPNHVLDGKSASLSLAPPLDDACETTFNFPPPPDTLERKDSVGKYDAPWDSKGVMPK